MKDIDNLAEAVAHQPREVKRHDCRTAEHAVSVFCDAKAQGYSPALIKNGKGWIVTVWA